MHFNRISEQFEILASQPPMGIVAPTPAQPQILPLVTVQSIYQAAAEQALRDHELDKLFNADYYGDHGSGI